MTSFWRIFWLELTAFVRSKALAWLVVASVAWMLVFPYLVRGDGTAEGARELYIHFSLGGVFALLVVSLLGSATGSIASDREAKRLQLTMVRPVRYAVIALGKIAAHVAVGAFIAAVAFAVLAFRMDLSRPCSHVLSPVMPSPQEEARAMYESFMADPSTPDAVKKAKKGAVLRLLAQRAVDNYQTIATNSTAVWRFESPCLSDAAAKNVAVRMRFTNEFDMRRDLIGSFRLGGMSGAISNTTQAVLSVPLEGSSLSDQLEFSNGGAHSLMIRPRKDLNLLVEADAFGWNLLRAYVEVVAVLTLIISFGVLLSAGLGRPVAMFVAFVTLIVGEMSPSVAEQYPDELETNMVDRIGLGITRFVAEVTRPVSSLSPLEALAKDECIESVSVMRIAGFDLLLLPIAMSLLAAIVIPRKQDDLV